MCRNKTRCCPLPTDDSIEGTTDYVQGLKTKCDGRYNCDVKIPQLIIRGENADYESVNYICSSPNIPTGKTS